jgi:hypothetical protein
LSIFACDGLPGSNGKLKDTRNFEADIKEESEQSSELRIKFDSDICNGLINGVEALAVYVTHDIPLGEVAEEGDIMWRMRG